MAKPCDSCGGHRWSAAGYCMEVACAGVYTDPDYPLNVPEELKWNRKSNPVEKKPSKPKAQPKPPKKGRRALELQYEAMGKKAPWLENQKPEGS